MAPDERSDDTTLQRQALIRELEARFRQLTDLLYDTRIPPERLEAEVLPHLAEEVTFKDPWQAASGREKYAVGMKGFHAMFDFCFEFHQVSVSLDALASGGRALVDGVMHLRQSSRVFSYPLRTILRYDFILASPAGAAGPVLQVTAHEEMWSLGDMIEALPLVGRLYAGAFRPAFARGFLAASRLASRLKSGPARAGGTVGLAPPPSRVG
jgi:hypothetical protein